MNLDIKLIDNICIICKNYSSIEKVLLFGSRARGDSSPRSDYDLAVFGQLSPNEIILVRNAFQEDLPTLHKIDVVFMQTETDEKLTANIEKEGVLIYDKARQ